VESHAEEIPPYLPLEEAGTRADYARMSIGGYTALLAQQADLHLAETTGEERYDRLEFTHCRAFSAESVIRFDEGNQDGAKALPAYPPAATAAPDGGEAVPALLLVTIELTAPIRDSDAPGTPISDGENRGDCNRATAQNRRRKRIAEAVGRGASGARHLHRPLDRIHHPKLFRACRHRDDPLPVDFSRRIRGREHLDNQRRSTNGPFVGW